MRLAEMEGWGDPERLCRRRHRPVLGHRRGVFELAKRVAQHRFVLFMETL
jgi:hypothetical protein